MNAQAATLTAQAGTSCSIIAATKAVRSYVKVATMVEDRIGTMTASSTESMCKARTCVLSAIGTSARPAICSRYVKWHLRISNYADGA